MHKKHLTDDAKQLSEVAVVGYGTVERKNLIGSLTKIDPADTKVIPVGSVNAQLEGIGNWPICRDPFWTKRTSGFGIFSTGTAPKRKL